MSPSSTSALALRLPVFAILAVLLSSMSVPCTAAPGEGIDPQPLSPPLVEQDLAVPYFEVDTTSGAGMTSLFAVRNLMDGPSYVSIDILSGEDGDRNVFRQLQPDEVWTVNLRDVEGLEVDEAGVARGWLEIYAQGPASEAGERVVAGDSFQVDVEQDLATAAEMVEGKLWWCDVRSLRFLDFGDGMRLEGVVKGGHDGPGSLTIQVYDEAGRAQELRTLELEEGVLDLELSELTAERFGTLVFDFSETRGGVVTGEVRAEGRYAVRLDPICEDAFGATEVPNPAAIDQVLVLPRFEVDTTSASGTTTLVAVRSLVEGETDVTIRFRRPDGSDLSSVSRTLGSREVWTLNLRDLGGLEPDADGVARGWAEVHAVGIPNLVGQVVAGDSFHVDVDQNFASSGNLGEFPLCDAASLRLLDFGDGMELSVFLGEVRPGRLPVTVQGFDEKGEAVGEPVTIQRRDRSFELDVTELTPLRFGSLVFDFSRAGGGIVVGRYSAEGRFSVALTSVCENS